MNVYNEVRDGDNLHNLGDNAESTDSSIKEATPADRRVARAQQCLLSSHEESSLWANAFLLGTS